jgi:predicted 3-demethylubiquinone-9 3-methyltransferase (glyoxalase superfamily)
MTAITPFLWFDDQAEAAVDRYVSLFTNSQVDEVSRLHDESVLVISFTLDGLALTAMNGGPMFRLNEAFSLSVAVDGQAEVDRLWDGLIAGGGEPSQCGWLKDPWGLSWQIIPSEFMALMKDPDPGVRHRTSAAMMTMGKLDVAALQAAAAG